jgi:hypothetical protein
LLAIEKFQSSLNNLDFLNGDQNPFFNYHLYGDQNPFLKSPFIGGHTFLVAINRVTKITFWSPSITTHKS